MSATYLAPEFRVDVNGATLAAEVSRIIMDLSVTLAPDAVDSVRFTLANPYPELRWTHTDDADLFREGNGVTVWMGYTGTDPVLMFDGEITGASVSFPESGPPTVQVEGFSRLHRLQRRTDPITLRDATDGDMVKKIADASQLGAQVDDPGTTYEQHATAGASHLQYLLELGRRAGREVWVEGTTLHFAAPRTASDPVYVLVWGRTSSNSTSNSLPLQSFSPTLDARKAPGAVVVKGQDPLTREPFEGRAGDGGGESGLGAPGELVVTGEPVSSPAEAEARAKALYDERALQVVQGTGVTLGVPGLRAGTVVTLDGLGPRFNGDYYVTRSMHSMGGSGYRTTFTVQKKPAA